MRSDLPGVRGGDAPRGVVSPVWMGGVEEGDVIKRRTPSEAEAWRKGAEYILNEAKHSGMTAARAEALLMALAMQREMEAHTPVRSVRGKGKLLK